MIVNGLKKMKEKKMNKTEKTIQKWAETLIEKMTADAEQIPEGIGYTYLLKEVQEFTDEILEGESTEIRAIFKVNMLTFMTITTLENVYKEKDTMNSVMLHQAAECVKGNLIGAINFYKTRGEK